MDDIRNKFFFPRTIPPLQLLLSPPMDMCIPGITKAIPYILPPCPGPRILQQEKRPEKHKLSCVCIWISAVCVCVDCGGLQVGGIDFRLYMQKASRFSIPQKSKKEKKFFGFLFYFIFSPLFFNGRVYTECVCEGILKIREKKKAKTPKHGWGGWMNNNIFVEKRGEKLYFSEFWMEERERERK